MSARPPLDALTDLARTRSDEATRRLGELQAASASAERQLALLLQYRRDYARLLQERMCAGLPSAQWSSYQQFLDALDDGIARQRQASAQAQDRLAFGRSDWQQQHRRLNAFETLAERRQRELAELLGRREQRDSDEHAARNFTARARAMAS